MKKLSESTLGILSRLEQANLALPGPAFVLRITDGQLDRSEYERLNGALEAIGGKWNRKHKGHVFETDPAEALDELLTTGEYKGKHHGDFFQTPESIADQMVKELKLQPGDRVLEPQAGHGRLARAAAAALAQAICIEIDPERCQVLRAAGFQVVEGDFLQPAVSDMAIERCRFKHIIANPPFSKRQDALHLLKMIRILPPGGRLASIAGAGVRFRQERIYCQLRDELERYGAAVVDLPERSFSAEGTDASAVLITLQK